MLNTKLMQLDMLFESNHNKINKFVVCAYNKDSDQPGHAV